jgi:hypothetical protein
MKNFTFAPKLRSVSFDGPSIGLSVNDSIPTRTTIVINNNVNNSPSTPRNFFQLTFILQDSYDQHADVDKRHHIHKQHPMRAQSTLLERQRRPSTTTQQRRRLVDNNVVITIVIDSIARHTSLLALRAAATQPHLPIVDPDPRLYFASFAHLARLFELARTLAT